MKQVNEKYKPHNRCYVKESYIE